MEPDDFAQKMAQKQYGEAVKIAQKLAEEAKGDLVAEGEAQMFAAKALLASGGRNEAIEVVQTAATLFKEFGDKTKQGLAMQLLSEACLEEGYALDARDVAEQAMILFRQSKYQKGQAEALILFSLAQTELGDFGKAAYRAEQASEIYKAMNDQQGGAKAMITSSRSFLAKKEKDPEAGSSVAREALRTASAAVRIYESVGETTSEDYATAVQTLAAAHLAGNDLDQAIEKVSEANAIFERVASPKGQARCMTVLAKATFEKGDVVEAASLARQAQSLFEEVADDQGASSMRTLIAKFQQGPGGEIVEAVPEEPQEDTSLAGVPNRVDIRRLVPGIEKATIYCEYEGYEGRSATVGARPRPKSERQKEAFAEVTREQAVFSVRWVRQQGASGDSAMSADRADKDDDVLNFPMRAGPGAPNKDALPSRVAQPRRTPELGKVPYTTGSRVLPKDWEALYA